MLSDTNVFVPDLVYVSDARARLVTEKNLQGAPDLAIEILSPGTRRRDERLKRDVYERLGVTEYWLVDPAAEAVTVYRRGAEGFAPPDRLGKAEVLITPLIPGLEIPLERIFR